MYRAIYTRLAQHSRTDYYTIQAGLNLSACVLSQGNFAETQGFISELLSDATSALGPAHAVTINIRGMYGLALHASVAASLADLILAEDVCEENSRTERQVLGRGHPVAMQALKELNSAREKLARVRANP